MTWSIDKSGFLPIHISNGVHTRRVTNVMLRNRFVAERISAHKNPGRDAATMSVLVLYFTVRLNLSATELLSGEKGGIV